jgi:hypothetical protein
LGCHRFDWSYPYGPPSGFRTRIAFHPLEMQESNASRHVASCHYCRLQLQSANMPLSAGMRRNRAAFSSSGCQPCSSHDRHRFRPSTIMVAHLHSRHQTRPDLSGEASVTRTPLCVSCPSQAHRNFTCSPTGLSWTERSMTEPRPPRSKVICSSWRASSYLISHGGIGGVTCTPQHLTLQLYSALLPPETQCAQLKPPVSN